MFAVNSILIMNAFLSSFNSLLWNLIGLKFIVSSPCKYTCSYILTVQYSTLCVYKYENNMKAYEYTLQWSKEGQVSTRVEEFFFFSSFQQRLEYPARFSWHAQGPTLAEIISPHYPPKSEKWIVFTPLSYGWFLSLRIILRSPFHRVIPYIY